MTQTSLSEEVSTGIAALPQGYHVLLAELTRALENDQRVLALFLGGSVGRGLADAGSDLDVLVTVADAHFDTFADDLAGILAPVLDPVIITPIPGMKGTNAYTTRHGLRVDVVLERLTDVDRPGFRRRVIVFDRGHVGTLISAPTDMNDGPDPAKIDQLIEEFLRQQAIFPAAVVARGDWLLGQEGVHHARGMLYQLFVEANQPLPPMGVKQWSSRLTSEQQQILAALELPKPTRESVIAAMTAVRASFRTHGRAAAESAGAAWPTEVDDAITGYWRSHDLEN